MLLTFHGQTDSGLIVNDLRLESGQIVTLTGASGSGKSRLLRALADLDPSGLVVHLDGQNMTATPPHTWRARICYASAAPHWWAEETLADVLASATAQDLAAALDVSLSHNTNRKAHQALSDLSTGEQQRIHLARVLAHPTARVFLLDEPTSALDDTSKHRVENLLREKAAAGLAILMTSHDSAQVSRLNKVQDLNTHHWHIDDQKITVLA